jgi:hypothetical protein
MNDIAVRVAAAAALLWLGMVLAISFMEAPLKFRAAGLDLRVGLSIGRIVFRALNCAELIWAVLIAAALVVHAPSAAIVVLASVLGVLFAVQLGAVRSRLNRRSDRVLAGEDVPRSASHHAYIALELAKVAALAVLSAALLAG